MFEARGRKRIVWLVLDAAGYEITRRCIHAGVCPSLSAIERQGYLGASRPSTPNCETPPALRALFSGSEPAASGIWGFRMPDYGGRLEHSLSGFDVPIRGQPAIWEDLEKRGCDYTLINAAFRKDPVWGRSFSGFDLLVDGYRRHRPQFVRMDRGAASTRANTRANTRIRFQGAALHVEPGRDGVRLRARRHPAVFLKTGQIRPLDLPRRNCGLAHCSADSVFLFSSSRPHVRLQKRLAGRSEELPPRFMHHANLFRYSRRNGGLTIDEELRPSELVTAQMGEMALRAIQMLSSTLTIVYFSLIDEISHVYLDRIIDGWPDSREAQLLQRCYRTLDTYIGKIMQSLENDTLLVVSADHGQAPYRRIIHLNELFAQAALVRRSGNGYDLRRSAAYYHPSGCGQVVINPRRVNLSRLSPGRIEARVLRCLEQANLSLGTRIAHLRGGQTDPYLLFLYPGGETHLSGRYDEKAKILDTNRRGGQHLSPLCPTPWMQALLGLWCPGGLRFPKADIPDRNAEVKGLLLNYLFADRSTS